MPGWKCFMVEPSEFCRRSLRRYWKAPDESSYAHYHDVSVVIDEQFKAPGHSGYGLTREGYETDPRWPAQCACGYAFTENDHWQVNEDQLYAGTPDGKLYTCRELPPGAIWRVTWWENIPQNKYADPAAKVWALMLPGGAEWLIYGPASDGGKWTVQGELPDITVAPSINQPGIYHGNLKGGVITQDCEGRQFPKHPFTA